MMKIMNVVFKSRTSRQSRPQFEHAAPKAEGIHNFIPHVNVSEKKELVYAAAFFVKPGMVPRSLFPGPCSPGDCAGLCSRAGLGSRLCCQPEPRWPVWPCLPLVGVPTTATGVVPSCPKVCPACHAFSVAWRCLCQLATGSLGWEIALLSLLRWVLQPQLSLWVELVPVQTKLMFLQVSADAMSRQTPQD